MRFNLLLRFAKKGFHSGSATRHFQHMSFSRQRHFAKADRNLSRYIMKRQMRESNDKNLLTLIS